MPVSVKQTKTVVASDLSPLVQEVGKGFTIVVKSSWTPLELEELGVAIATLVNKVLSPIT